MNEIIKNDVRCDHYFCINDLGVPQCYSCQALISNKDLKKHLQRKFGEGWKIEWEQLKKNKRLIRAEKIEIMDLTVINNTEDDKITIRIYYENNRCC